MHLVGFTIEIHIGYLVIGKDEEGGKKYWVHPHFNKSGKLGSFIVAREPDKGSESFGLFYTKRRGKPWFDLPT